MNPEDVGRVISEATSGLQIAFIHLGNILEQRGVITKEELALSFEATAEALPEDLKSRDISQKILNGIASGLRNKGKSPPELKLVH